MPDDTLATIPTAHRERLARLSTQSLAILDADEAAWAADQLAFCQSIRQSVEHAKTATLSPLRVRLDWLRQQYDTAILTVRTAEDRVKTALLAWRTQETAVRAQAAADAAHAQAALVAAEARRDATEAGLSPEAAEEIRAGVAATVATQISASLAPAPVPPVVAGVAGTASVRTTWTFTVTNPILVPRAYLMVDEGKIRKAVLGGMREMPGVEIRQVESIVGRRR